METLEELKNTYKKLQEESNNLYSKIKALEKRNAISKFTVGDCYLNTKWNDLIKIVSIKDNYIYYICLDKDCITRDYSYIYDIEDWEKITPHQFKDAWDTRSLEDVCQMCHKVHDLAYMMYKKSIMYIC